MKKNSELQIIFKHLMRDPLGMIGFFIVMIIFLSAIFADWLVPYDPIQLNIKDRLQGPSW